METEKINEQETPNIELEKQLAETEYKLALALTLANTAFDALLIVDEQLQVVASNTSAETLFNVKPSTRLSLQDWTHLPALEMMVESANLNDESFEEQINIDDKTFRVRAQIIQRAANRFVGLTLQDITQLVRLNRARRDMVANISHELRTPIANIRLTIDGLFHDQDKPKRKDSISSLRAIARETDSLLWLVQEMADLSMIESGQAIIRMVEVQLVDIINDAIERLANQSEIKNLKIVKHVPDKLHVLCDRDLTKRVIVNLLHNAIKWSPPGEAITINATTLEEDVTVSVFDNGPGVPQTQIERIFERFYQVDASRSGHEGTGLGLAICKHIVEAHGGRIWAESNVNGGGGRFSFTLLRADV